MRWSWHVFLSSRGAADEKVHGHDLIMGRRRLGREARVVGKQFRFDNMDGQQRDSARREAKWKYDESFFCEKTNQRQFSSQH